MRDENRLKEKVEVSLDNRQVVGLAASALLCLAVVFASGVLVGKRLAASTAAREPADVLAALDSKVEGDKMVMEAARGEIPAPVAAPPAPAAAPAPVAVPAPIPPPVAPPAPAKRTLDTALASVSAPVAPPPPRIAPPAPTGSWTVQVAATQEKTDAERRARQLEARGVSARIAEAIVLGKGRFYRVQVGRFQSREDAERYKKDLDRQGGFQSFVTKVL